MDVLGMSQPLILKKVKKGEILLLKGDHCQYGYRVVKGCLRSYIINKTGKEHILQFAPEDWLVSDLDSIFNNKPATIFIDAIEDSEVLLLNKLVFQNIENMEKPALLEQNTRLVRNIIASNKRFISLLSSSAEERYEDFTETYPTLVQRLPLKQIASYIGITPEHLSFIRKKMAGK